MKPEQQSVAGSQTRRVRNCQSSEDIRSAANSRLPRCIRRSASTVAGPRNQNPPRGLAPRTPLHRHSLAASPARSIRLARSHVACSASKIIVQFDYPSESLAALTRCDARFG